MAKRTDRLAWSVANAHNAEIADVDIFDVIGDPWGDGVNAGDFVKELRGIKAERINFHINSPGGYVNDALAMYNAVLSHPAETFGYVVGSADSSASLLFQAMRTRVIAKQASMFIHTAQGMFYGDAAAAEAMRDVLNEETANLASIYAERAGGTVDEWLERMNAGPSARRGTHMRGSGAVELGLADEVGISQTITDAHMERVAALSRNQKPAGDDPPAPTLAAIPPLADRLGYTPPSPDLVGLLEKHQIKVGG